MALGINPAFLCIAGACYLVRQRAKAKRNPSAKQRRSRLWRPAKLAAPSPFPAGADGCPPGWAEVDGACVPAPRLSAEQGQPYIPGIGIVGGSPYLRVPKRKGNGKRFSVRRNPSIVLPGLGRARRQRQRGRFRPAVAITDYWGGQGPAADAPTPDPGPTGPSGPTQPPAAPKIPLTFNLLPGGFNPPLPQD